MRDALILAALVVDPTWFDRKIAPRLDGYPDRGSCWSWTGATDPLGYGHVGLPGTKAPTVLTHRVVWLVANGPIADALVIDHDGPSGCHNRGCANPAHLQAVTQAVNIANGPTTNSCKTRCPAGHELGGSNVLPVHIRAGWRSCRECRRDRSREQSRAITAAVRALGIRRADYLATYGFSARVAQELITSTQLEGARP